MDNNTKIILYGLDGGRREVPLYMKDELLKKGWVIRDSKEEYIPSLDRTLKSYKENEEEVDVKDGEFLEYKVV